MLPPHEWRVQGFSLVQVEVAHLMAADGQGALNCLPLPACLDAGLRDVDHQMILPDFDPLIELEGIVEGAILVALPTVKQDKRAGSRPILLGQHFVVCGEPTPQESPRHLVPVLVAERHDPKVRVCDNFTRQLDVVDADVVERALALFIY